MASRLSYDDARANVREGSKALVRGGSNAGPLSDDKEDARGQMDTPTLNSTPKTAVTWQGARNAAQNSGATKLSLNPITKKNYAPKKLTRGRSTQPRVNTAAVQRRLGVTKFKP